MMDNQRSPLAAAVESTNSPLGAFAESIGKISDDWSVELSPIAHTRDSLNGSSPIVTLLVDSNAPSSPLRSKKEETTGIRDAKELARGDARKSIPKTSLGASSQASLKSTRTIFRNPYLNKEENAMKPAQADNRSWFLLSEEPTTTPTSTSSEFSLESLSENDVKDGSTERLGNGSKENEDDPKPEASADWPSLGLETQSTCRHDDENKTETATNHDSHSKPPTAARRSLEPKEASSMKESAKEKAKLDETSIPPAVPGENSTHVLDTSSCHPTTDNGTTSEEAQEVVGTNHSAELSTLIEDATLKVRKFIYELSVLDSSTSPMNSSEDDSALSDSDGAAKAEGNAEESNHEAEIERWTEQAGDSLPSPIAQKSMLSSSTTLLHSSFDRSRTWQTPPKKGEPGFSSRNNSVDEGTPRTPGKLDFTNAKKEVGESSNDFIQKLRGAAQKRKQEMARSRDSLIAKEREQREAIASSRIALKPRSPAISTPKAPRSNESPKRQKPPPSASFRAKPLPATTGDLGSGGLAGVPKVAKKPTTVPKSPKLGPRRTILPKIKALKQPATRPRVGDQQETKSQPKKKLYPPKKSGFFKARPAPRTTGELGRSGQSGVPKVPKRPVTTPSSPCLGRRRHSSVVGGKENQKEGRRVSTGMVKRTPCGRAPRAKASPMSISSFSQGTPVLLGLDLLSLKSCEAETPPVRTPPNAQISAFEPRSTHRAKKRAEFEARRVVNEQLRLEEDVEDREKRVQKMYKELDSLREVI